MSFIILSLCLFLHVSPFFQVLVTVNESSMFEFVTSAGDESLLAATRHVSVSRQKSTMVSFAITATQLGQMPISVKAMSLYTSDSVSQTILVKVTPLYNHL